MFLLTKGKILRVCREHRKAYEGRECPACAEWRRESTRIVQRNIDRLLAEREEQRTGGTKRGA